MRHTADNRGGASAATGVGGKQGAWQMPLRLTIAHPTAIVWVLFAVPAAAAATFFRGDSVFDCQISPENKLNLLLPLDDGTDGARKRELAF